MTDDEVYRPERIERVPYTVQWDVGPEAETSP